jgi:hypothetical protein
MPLAEILWEASRVVELIYTSAVCDDALNDLEFLQCFLLPLALNLVTFLFFGIPHVDFTENHLLGFDIIVHAFDTLVLLQELVELIRIMKV